MQKPNAFDTTQATREFTPPTVGGHHGKLMKLEESTTRTGKDMVIVAFDFAQNDSQPGYMAEEFRNDIRPDKKWPRAGRQYIVVTDDNGNCSRSFKSFINAVEKSNPGFQVQWGDNFGAQFKGLKVGLVFGEVENEYNGKRSMRTELRWFCEDSKVDEAKVPEPKYLPNNNVVAAAPVQAQANTMAGFVNVADVDLEEIPF